MQVATRADRGRRGKALSAPRMKYTFMAAAAATLILAPGSASAGAAQLAQRMSPVQDMNQSSGAAQAQRVAPMSGTSRAGLLDEMGRSPRTRQSAAVAPSNMRPAAEPGGAQSSSREQRRGVTQASATRPGASQDVNAISDFNRTEGALLVSNRSGIREISQLRGTTICFPNPADQAEAARFLGGRAVSFTALTADGPPDYLVNAFQQGACQAIYMSRQTQQMMASLSIPDALVLTR